MLHESIFTEVAITGVTVYGLALLFVKALLVLLLAQILADSLVFSSASIRHSIWLIALVSLAALPSLTLVLPAWHLFSIELPAVVSATSADVVLPPVNSAAIAEGLSTIDWLVIIYLVVVIARFSYLSLEVFKVGWITAKANKADDEWYQQARVYFDGRLKIKVSSALSGPVTWGTLYPVILLPISSKQWSPLEREMVLRHELGHIRRADWLAQLLGQLVAVLYWPVPGIAKTLAALSLEAERACDDSVLAVGVTPADYAALLVRQAKVNSLQATVALGKPSELAERVKHIVSSYVDRAGERKTRLWLSITASLFLIPFASIQAIGSLSRSGDLSDSLLIPVVMAPSPSRSVEQDIEAVDINRPDRPVSVIRPPESPAVEFSIQSVAWENSVDSFTTSGEIPLADVGVAGISYSKVTVLSKQRPEYPSVAKRRGIEGRVVVVFDIDEDGRAINPRISDSGASTMFNRSVLKAIRAYQYSPYILDGQAVGLKGLTEEFRFKLIQDPPTKRASAGDSRAGQVSPINSS